MKCERIRELIPDLLGKEIGLRDRLLLELHLLGCSSCRTEVKELRRVMKALEALKVREKTRVQLPEVEVEKRGSPLWWKVIPAAVAAGLILGLWLYRPRGPQFSEPPSGLFAWAGIEEFVEAMPDEAWQRLVQLYLPQGGEEWEEILLGSSEEDQLLPWELDYEEGGRT